jgi:SAM-dependent methyltransferase
MTDTAAQRWTGALASWGIPDDVLAQAPASPWIHPPKLFEVRGDELPDITTPSYRAALDALGDGGTVLDVGCGGGASSIGLAPPATTLIGFDHSEAMLVNFATACSRRNVACETVVGDWPTDADRAPMADVVVCHHVAYNVGDAAGLVAALTSHARRRVVVELPERHPTSSFSPLWKHFWDLDRPTEPSADLFAEVVAEAGVLPVVERLARPSRKTRLDDAEYVAFVRQRLCLGADRDAEITDVLTRLHPSNVIIDTVTVWWDVL